jgi:hypothetical protein
MALTLETAFESSVATINWDPTSRIMIFAWKSFATGQLFREAIEQNIRLVQQFHATKLLVNSTLAGAFKAEDQNVLSTEYPERMQQAGIQFMALLVPDNIVATMSQERVVKNALSLYTIETFKTLDEALSWLKAQK